MKKIVFSTLNILIAFFSYGVQFEILNNGAKNVAIGGGTSVFKDPMATLINPANLSLEKSSLTLYYEASSSVNVGSLLELYNRRFIFNFGNVGISAKLDEFTRVSFLLSSYIYDLDVPEITYRVLLFGISKKVLPFLLVGASLGPVLGMNENSVLLSFLAVAGTTLKLNDILNASVVAKSPFSVNYINPYYGEISQTFPPIISCGISFLVTKNTILSTATDIILVNNISARANNREIFTPRDDISDYILPRLGLVYYDEISGYRIMFGFHRTQVEAISDSLHQYHLTSGVTFFIRIPGFREFEINFCADDGILLNLLNIAPQNVKKISLYVSGETRF
ncbi:MAG: hypothetical protein ABDH28_03770 [Brevinematia bacterium]